MAKKVKFEPNTPVKVKRTDSDITRTVAYRKATDANYRRRHQLVIVDDRLTGTPEQAPPPNAKDNRTAKEKVDELKGKMKQNQKSKDEKTASKGDEKPEGGKSELPADKKNTGEEKTGADKPGNDSNDGNDDKLTMDDIKDKKVSELRAIASDMDIKVAANAKKAEIQKMILNG